MRLLLSLIVLVFALPCIVSADPSTTPDYTTEDQAKFAKLQAWNGTWKCNATPGGVSFTLTARQLGNWFIWTDDSENASTTYVRWDHGTKVYVQYEIDRIGSAYVATTSSPDPFNATWTVLYPANFPASPFTYSFTAARVDRFGQHQRPQDRDGHDV